MGFPTAATAGATVSIADVKPESATLLNFVPVRLSWAGRRAKRGDGAAVSRALPPRRPLSASLPAKGYEIDPGPAP
jgi:hypothetical protein